MGSRIADIARSEQTDAAILDAATRVLERDGAAGFNTNRVAERAGVSVGSLYQYYPNKVALLFALQEREIRTTTAMLEGILAEESWSPRRRVVEAVRGFFETEAAEARLRHSLQDAEVWLRDSPELTAARARIFEVVLRFLESTTRRKKRDLPFAASVIVTVVSSVAESLTSTSSDPDLRRRWADTIASMLANEFGIVA
ncbi:TetR/AcrR family transcriptional regulator [Candidatus Binatia bacterium]|jgi:AcrR family transcriptional regulator|nr:TetR/AcrR family transcriptional regulator [Candidatus Binatia bacterium]